MEFIKFSLGRSRWSGRASVPCLASVPSAVGLATHPAIAGSQALGTAAFVSKGLWYLWGEGCHLLGPGTVNQTASDRGHYESVD